MRDYIVGVMAFNFPLANRSYRGLKKANNKLGRKDRKLNSQFRKDALKLRDSIEGFEKAKGKFGKMESTPGINRGRELEFYWENERLLKKAGQFKGRDEAIGEAPVKGEAKVGGAIKKIDEFVGKNTPAEEMRKQYPLIFPKRKEQTLAGSPAE